MARSEFDERPGRETRLLVLVVVVAVAVLLVLARFRFPSSDLSVVPPLPSPLERLATRSMFDEMGATLAAMVQRIAPAIVIVPVEPDAPTPVAAPGSKPAPTGPPSGAAPEPSGDVAAIRVRSGLAVVMLPPGTHVSAPVQVVATDAARGLTLLRVDPADDVRGSLPDLYDGFGGFSYVAVVEAVAGGPSARPVFVGRVESLTDERWFSPPLLIGGAMEVPPGSLVFALDGRFIGLAWRHERGVTLILPSALDAVVDDLTRPAGGPGR